MTITAAAQRIVRRIILNYGLILIYLKIIGAGAVPALVISFVVFRVVATFSESSRSHMGMVGLGFQVLFLLIIAVMKAVASVQPHNAMLFFALFFIAIASLGIGCFCLFWRWSWLALPSPFILSFAATLILHDNHDTLGYANMGALIAGIIFLTTGLLSGIGPYTMRWLNVNRRIDSASRNCKKCGSWKRNSESELCPHCQEATGENSTA